MRSFGIIFMCVGLIFIHAEIRKLKEHTEHLDKIVSLVLCKGECKP